MNQALCGNPELQVMDPYVHLSESLEEMKQEHHELLLKLQELHAVARSIGYDEQVPDWSVKLEGLKDLVEQFRFRFMRHNKRKRPLYTRLLICTREIKWANLRYAAGI
ncbi:hypothetical protein [Paenibacillus larvae]|uniref:hypothetical protein n=1 Tax=Paenibacillus larvae TaxID=1464 RepID=UPI00288D19E8|nr:hypothetical protein [Paenibacillus larvae]MDT2193919.1 hypothetical protein [Paenibacillus larvae]